MELKEFVTQTLTQITAGVVEAQSSLAGLGAKVNPRLRHMLPQGEKNYSSIGWAEGEGGIPVLIVTFDIAVEEAQGTRTKGGIGVVTGILSLGSSGSTDKDRSAATRIGFQVPLMLPAHPNTP